ncbi:uncharacterized protein LOC142831312, partial [Pelodiscus sinensis]|uniref:uncharacterized protein LOC142831312 n=1 Tax=Pelodiscus sinensis TaxID=13735 RepID=UPI003F6B6134
MFSLILSLLACAVRLGLARAGAACPRVCKCSSADTVHCASAGLRTLPAELAASAVSVRLSDNMLRVLTPSTFRNLTALRSLWLDRNQLTFLYPGTFSALGQLRELDLSRNPRLTFLHANTFRGLSGLTRLDLSRCNLFEIHPLVFAPLLSLRALDLASNNLRYIPQAFRGLASLARLSLERNHIEAIGRASLKSLPALYDLNLRKNGIGTVQHAAFTALSRLGVLHLGHNRIADLPNQLFEGLSQLTTMHLEANRLSSINCSFNSLPNLRTLYLNNNRIASISHAAFARLRKLQFLHLSKNNLSSLPAPVLAALPQLKFLLLAHNPWNCDCKMGWFPSWRATYRGAVEGLQCAGPGFPNATLHEGFPHGPGPGCSAPARADKCEEAEASAAAVPRALSDTFLWAACAWCTWHVAGTLDKSAAGLGAEVSAFFACEL